MILSKAFAVGDSREIGRKDLGSLVGFPGFNIGIIFALFQICGMEFVVRELLKILVNVAIATGPRFLM